MSTAPAVSYGAHVADDSELRLCGDVAGKRIVELGVAAPPNAIGLAAMGAKVITVDPSAEAIADVRRRAEAAEVRVECHRADLADLGFITSASIDVVLLVHRLGEVDDVARLFRQVHRVLRPECPLIIAVTHPARAMAPGDPVAAPRRYGHDGRTLGQLFMALQRSNFLIDVLHELDPVDRPGALAPDVLLLRARKLGV